MDALYTTLLSVFLAEMGDRTQILAAALALRFQKNHAIIAGLACATLLNCAMSALGGSFIDSWISAQPVKFFAGLAYIFAGAGMLFWRRNVDPLRNWKTSAFSTAFLGLFILQFGDKSQFIIAAQSARTPLWGMTLAGGFVGIMAATVPAVIMRDKLAQIVPLKPIRWLSGAIFLIWGAVLATQAFGIS
ncbi:TMEM165/GDT1 family protein [Sphingorhabdus sp.]|uniref:TMEM165/GDT1 family protein n=1 Tax=Sphingorhabdus sp. TaxID=1902408 RepID=UPI0039193F73